MIRKMQITMQYIFGTVILTLDAVRTQICA